MRMARQQWHIEVTLIYKDRIPDHVRGRRISELTVRVQITVTPKNPRKVYGTDQNRALNVRWNEGLWPLCDQCESGRERLARYAAGRNGNVAVGEPAFGDATGLQVGGPPLQLLPPIHIRVGQPLICFGRAAEGLV